MSARIYKHLLVRGENRVTLPLEHELVGACVDGENAWVVVVADSESKEFNEIPFMVGCVGQEIPDYATNYLGCGKIGEDIVVVWEIL